MRKNKFFPILILLIFITITPVMATITATYTPHTPLYFTTGTILNSTIQGNPINSSYFGAHLGTLAIYSNETMTDLSLVNMSTTTEHFGYTGDMFYNEYDWTDWQNPVKKYRSEETEFTLYALSYPNGNLSFKTIFGSDGIEPLTNTMTITNTPIFIVELYLINHYALSHYVEGASYQLTSGNPGTFKLAVADEGSNIYNNVNYIPVNGSSAEIDIINNSGASVPYGPPDPDPNPDKPDYLLSIIQEPAISLPDAYGTNRTKVAKAKITMENAESGKKYKVDIKFDSDSVYQGRFYLHLDGILSQYSIPYDLYFKQDIVEPGVNIRWGNIQANTANEKTIEVTGVIQDDAERAPAGTYRDTITVTITPVDTV
ncbi:MAG: spore coat protein U domain-containing protein [Sphaerochaeta sp.]|nr:spore coat protein U domain-containing protein [Sphaerochaeta sp.]